MTCLSKNYYTQKDELIFRKEINEKQDEIIFSANLIGSKIYGLKKLTLYFTLATIFFKDNENTARTFIERNGEEIFLNGLKNNSFKR